MATQASAYRRGRRTWVMFAALVVPAALCTRRGRPRQDLSDVPS